MARGCSVLTCVLLMAFSFCGDFRREHGRMLATTSGRLSDLGIGLAADCYEGGIDTFV